MELPIGRAMVEDGDDALAGPTDPPLDKLPRQPAIGAEPEREVAAQRLTEAVLIVDADAGCFERCGGQRRERLEIGEEQVGLFHQGQLPNQVERLAAGAEEVGKIAERAERAPRRRGH